MQWYQMTSSSQFKDDLIVVPTGLENLRYPQLYRTQEGWVRGVVRFPFIVAKPTLGIITALTQPNPDALRAVIRETRAATAEPFGVNITLLPSINIPDYEGFARAAVEEGVKIFETAGNNRPYRRILTSGEDPDTV
jgi:hypothetical protein